MDPMALFMIVFFLSASVLGIFLVFVRPYHRARTKQKQAMERLAGGPMPTGEDEDIPVPMLEEHRATLVKKVCGTKMIGTKYVECRVEYWLFFEDEFEREIPLLVEEEIYLAIEEGDTGILALSDGKLYGFTLDE